nr:Arf family protein [Candidatus Sigynarchaeota archaeon]
SRSIGYEFGFQRQLNVVETRPKHWEQNAFDISTFITKVNEFKKKVHYRMPKLQIFVFGLDRVGKTTLVSYLQENKFVNHAPTIGVSISQIVLSNLTLEFTDVGGQKRFRPDWENYLKQPHIMVFVIDASDRAEERIQEGRNELHRMLQNPKTTGLPLLVLINKIDLDLRMQRDIIEKKYGLDKIEGRELSIYEVSASTGQNMDAALNAITTMVLKDDGVEYFVNQKVKEQTRSLLDRYKKFFQAGMEAYKTGNLDNALASMNIARDIASNLFQLGVLAAGGRDYKKLSNIVAKLEREIEEKASSSAPTGILDETDATIDEITATLQQQPLPMFAAPHIVTGPGTPGPPKSLPTKKKAPSGRKTIKDVRFYIFGTDAQGIESLKQYFIDERFLASGSAYTITTSRILLGNIGYDFLDASSGDAGQIIDIAIFIVDSLKPNTFNE